MSLLKLILTQLGKSTTPANNFTLSASPDDGTLTLYRGNAGTSLGTVLGFDAAGKANIPGGLTAASLSGLTLVQSQTTPLPGTVQLISFTHGLGVTPVAAEVEIVCLTAELGYAVGDTVVPFTTANGSFVQAFSVAKNSSTVSARTGSSVAWAIVNLTTGSNVNPTAANWAWRFKVRVA